MPLTLRLARTPLGDESPLDNTNPSKRRRTSLMILAQMEPLQAADDDDEMGLHIFDSSALMTGRTLQLTVDQTQPSKQAEETKELGLADDEDAQVRLAISDNSPLPKRRPKKKTNLKRDHGGQSGHTREP